MISSVIVISSIISNFMLWEMKPNLPTNITPTKIAWLKTFREVPSGHKNSTPQN